MSRDVQDEACESEYPCQSTQGKAEEYDARYCDVDEIELWKRERVKIVDIFKNDTDKLSCLCNGEKYLVIMRPLVTVLPLGIMLIRNENTSSHNKNIGCRHFGWICDRVGLQRRGDKAAVGAE